ncbi:uncharacterized protein GGS22DRAFT_188866 [Annulohypoxylon maeteangense]|uniref:uncharacterized protein n=1 Tax=Annulohypoxylon maeteangense TaxID=1927788 RepID=UPI0020088E47|nr:uncharacterized protein GGS22DRAFT_188866 [Annulohypoxylon maeteangense]KAI0884656.1 hypothetical protein GGS22DRAFT_188866 [Annulohypoxylon maeteangense]
MTKRLVCLNKALAAARPEPAKAQVETCELQSHSSEPKQNINRDSQLRRCEGCRNMFPSFDVPTIRLGDIDFPLYFCHTCSMMTPAQRAHKKARYWSAILKHWRPEHDMRGSCFAAQEGNPIKLLCCLHELAQHYAWAEVASMVNSIILERLRHGPAPSARDRYGGAQDFYRVYEACKAMRFHAVAPEPVHPDEMAGLDLALDFFGLVVRDPGSRIPEVICDRAGACPNVLPCCDRIIFTRAYRTRHGCNA